MSQNWKLFIEQVNCRSMVSQKASVLQEQVLYDIVTYNKNIWLHFVWVSGRVPETLESPK